MFFSVFFLNLLIHQIFEDFEKCSKMKSIIINMSVLRWWLAVLKRSCGCLGTLVSADCSPTGWTTRDVLSPSWTRFWLQAQRTKKTSCPWWRGFSPGGWMSREPPSRAHQQAPPTSNTILIISDPLKYSGCVHVYKCGSLSAPAGPDLS